MAKIFITGSADGLGHLAAKQLLLEGHEVVLHARNQSRAAEAMKKIPSASQVLIADLSDLEEGKRLAEQANELGTFDVVIHNAGVYQEQNHVLAVNTLAPYILTALMHKPKRLIYMSSGMHLSGRFDKENFAHTTSYSDTKLHDVLLAFAVARIWPEVYSNAIDPGWVATKMGGKNAPDDLYEGYQTQIWLATGNDAKVSGRYFHHQKESKYNSIADHIDIQNEFLQACEKLTNISFP
jgi:NAD(P)-dependent dehydrogenase (short-subunit alcohol dehydrogenase family)